MTSICEPRHFRSPAELRRWFARHHADASELFVSYWKVGSGEKSVTWPDSVDEALCVGWIDGVRKRIDDQRYVYSFEQRSIELPDACTNLLQANPAAWADWQRRAPSYRKAAMWWVASVKQDATRERRLATLIDCGASG